MGVATRVRQPVLGGVDIQCKSRRVLVVGTTTTHSRCAAFPAFRATPGDILFVDITVEASGEAKCAKAEKQNEAEAGRYNGFHGSLFNYGYNGSGVDTLTIEIFK